MTTLYSKVLEIQEQLGHPEGTPEFPAEFLTKAIVDSQNVIVTALAVIAEELFPASIFNTYSFSFVSADTSPSSLGYMTITGLPMDLLKPTIVTLDNKNCHRLNIRKFFENISYGMEKREQKLWTSWGRGKILIYPNIRYESGLLYYIATPPSLDWTKNQESLTVPDELSTLINSFVLIRCKYKIRDYNGAVAAQNLFNNDINLMLKTFQIAPPQGTTDPVTPK